MRDKSPEGVNINNRGCNPRKKGATHGRKMSKKNNKKTGMISVNAGKMP
jgi:hypothetical protein